MSSQSNYQNIVIQHPVADETENAVGYRVKAHLNTHPICAYTCDVIIFAKSAVFFSRLGDNALNAFSQETTKNLPNILFHMHFKLS